MLLRVFNRTSRPEARQWQCTSCRSLLRLTPDSGMKIWIVSIIVILILVLTVNFFSSAILHVANSLGEIGLAIFLLIFLDFCLTAYFIGEIELLSQT